MGNDADSGEDVFDVERIVSDRVVKGRREYLIKWVGYPDSENTWECEDNLMCEEMLAAYRKRKDEKEKREVAEAKNKASKPKPAVPPKSTTPSKTTAPSKSTTSTKPPVSPSRTETTKPSVVMSPNPPLKLPKMAPLVTNEWNEKIDKIIGATLDDNGEIIIEYVMTTGQIGSTKSSSIRYKAPLKLIEFYEDNLTFPE